MSSNPLIVLASASPRRSALLAQIGVEHRVMPVDVDEQVQSAERAANYVRRLAVAKAQRAWSQLPAAERLPVLGADTSVVLDEQILGKPRDCDDCRRMLRQLSGRTHQVFTAVALRSEQMCEVRLSVSDVTFRPLEDAEIEAYWLSGEPVDKAGAYAIQGRAALFIERSCGSYSGIVGLPLWETGELLKRVGWSLSGVSHVSPSNAAHEEYR